MFWRGKKKENGDNLEKKEGEREEGIERKFYRNWRRTLVWEVLYTQWRSMPLAGEGRLL